jgi:hypothetical protein
MLFFLISLIIIIIIAIFALSFFRRKRAKESFEQKSDMLYGNFEIEQVVILTKGNRTDNIKIEYDNASVDIIKGNPIFCSKGKVCRKMPSNITSIDSLKETFVQLDKNIHPYLAQQTYKNITDSQTKDDVFINKADTDVSNIPLFSKGSENEIRSGANLHINTIDSDIKKQQYDFKNTLDDLKKRKDQRRASFNKIESNANNKHKEQSKELSDQLEIHQIGYYRDIEKKEDVDDVSLNDAAIEGKIEEFQSNLNKQFTLKIKFVFPFNVSNKTTYEELHNALFKSHLKGKLYFYVEDTFQEFFDVQICDKKGMCTLFNRNSTVIDVKNDISHINVIPT